MVPLYRESQRFGRSIDQLTAFIGRQPQGSELLFVDDGSDDGTAHTVEAHLADHPEVPARLLRRPHRGKGAAVRAGLEEAQGAVSGFCDVDLSTSLDDLAWLVEAARAAPILAIASRDLATSRVVRSEGKLREALGRLFNRLVQASLLPGIVDTQCGAKVARTELWRRVLPSCQEDGLAWDVEVIALARRMGVSVQELPVSWRHDPASQVHLWRDGASMVTAIPRIRRRVAATPPATTPPATAPTATGDRADASTSTFGAENAATLAAADTSHWWFRSKAAYVAGAIRRSPPPAGWLVDVGGGSAGVTALLGWPPRRTLVVEGSAELVGHGPRRHGLRAAQADVTALPLAAGSASVVCLLDVIEHLPDPAPALHEARRLLAPGGRLIVTVPAHPSLWSKSDEALGHARRYTRASLRAELGTRGFEVVSLSHIFSWLVAPVWAKRRVGRDGPELGLDVDSLSISAAALVLTRLERAVTARVSLPVGTSILAVCEPPNPIL